MIIRQTWLGGEIAWEVFVVFWVLLRVARAFNFCTRTVSLCFDSPLRYKMLPERIIALLRVVVLAAREVAIRLAALIGVGYVNRGNVEFIVGKDPERRVHPVPGRRGVRWHSPAWR